MNFVFKQVYRIEKNCDIKFFSHFLIQVLQFVHQSKALFEFSRKFFKLKIVILALKCEFLNEVLTYHDFGLELVKNGCLKSFNFKDENSSKQGLY